MLGINGRKIFLFLFFVQVVCAGQSPVPCSEALGRLTHLIKNNTFEVRREFSNYAELFPQSFLTDISRLKSQNHWLDAGSGEGFAVEDIHNEMVLHVESFLKNAEASYWQPRRILLNTKAVSEAAEALNFKSSSDKPKITGVAFKMERKAPEIPGVEFKTGRYFEDIPDAEISRADIITDLYGVMSYSPRVDEVLRKYHKILKTDGKAYIFIGDYVQVPPLIGMFSEARLGEPGWFAPFATSQVKLKNGKTVTLLDWVMSLKGFKAQLDFRKVEQRTWSSNTPGSILRSTIVLEKNSDEAEIPSLRLMESNQGKPPVRVFGEVELKENSAQQ